MSTYSEYVAKASLGFVTLADRFCRQLSLGKRDCLLENRIKILWAQIDMLSRVFSDDCGDDDMAATMYYINTLICDQSLGTTVSDTPSVIAVGAAPIVVTTEVTYCADITNLFLYPIYIPFTKDGAAVTLGSNGDAYNITFSAYNEDDEVVDILITDRTKYGFVARSLDEGTITFEWTATLKS